MFIMIVPLIILGVVVIATFLIDDGLSANECFKRTYKSCIHCHKRCYYHTLAVRYMELERRRNEEKEMELDS